MPRSLQRLGGDRSDGGHHDAARAGRARRCRRRRRRRRRPRARRRAGRGGEHDRVDLAGGDGRGPTRSRRRRPAAVPSGTRRGCATSRTGGRERLVETVGARAVVLHRDLAGRRRPRRAAPRAISALVSDSATQSAVSPAAWIAPRALGPRATIRVPREHRDERLVEQPAASAASIQPRNPMPVVTTTMSGGSASSDRVPSSSAASSMCGHHAERRARAGRRHRGARARRRARPTDGRR